MKSTSVCILLALVLCHPVAQARSGGGHHSASHGTAGHSAGSHSGGSHAGSTSHHRSDTAPGVKRDSHGKIARSEHAKSEFKKQHPCPSTGKSSGACPGYVIDHVTPLKRGGADAPGNMQWQTREAARQKDKTE